MYTTIFIQTLINILQTVSPCKPLITNASISPRIILRNTLRIIFTRICPIYRAMIRMLAINPPISRTTIANITIQRCQFTSAINTRWGLTSVIQLQLTKRAGIPHRTVAGKGRSCLGLQNYPTRTPMLATLGLGSMAGIRGLTIFTNISMWASVKTQEKFKY